MESLGISIYSFLPSANKDNFTFPIGMLFFPCLIGMARIFNTMMNHSGQSIFLLFLILEEKLSGFCC